MSNFKTYVAVIFMATMTACATCERHPVYCAVGTAIVVGSVAATVAANHHSSTKPAPTYCYQTNPSLCPIS